jgi:hypothetical protein
MPGATEKRRREFYDMFIKKESKWLRDKVGGKRERCIGKLQ